MKRQMFFATVFSAALAVSGAAQTGTGAQTGSQPDAQKNQQVTMTGCLQKASSGTAGTSGAAGTAASSSGDQFILSNASPSSASTGTAGTTGAAAGAASSAMGSKYRLMGGDREDLEKYLNSKVEIRGTIDRSSAGSMAGTASGTGTGTGATGTSAGQSDTDKLPALRVTSVRQLEKTCTGGN